MKYFELLKNPKWQKKRLLILERDGWACKDCGATDKTLNVHHHVYKKGAKPWEYRDCELVSLCEDCHESRHAELTQLQLAVKCFASQLSQQQIERFHKALMFKGPALETILEIVKGGASV